MSIDLEKGKKLKINKSTLWYQQKKIKEGESMKISQKDGEQIWKRMNNCFMIN